MRLTRARETGARESDLSHRGGVLVIAARVVRCHWLSAARLSCARVCAYDVFYEKYACERSLICAGGVDASGEKAKDRRGA